MRKLLTFLFLFVVCTVAGPANANDAKVTICHRTNSVTNPYVQITVDEHAVDGLKGADHYGKHKGPIFAPGLKDQHIKWGDIIPPVAPYHGGLNWTADGIAIYENGCDVPNSETPETPVDSPDKETPEAEVDTPIVIVRAPAVPVVGAPAFTG